MNGSLDKMKDLLNNLNKIGIALSAEKDTEKLLQIILEESMNITSSDGGSLYIKEYIENQEMLRFKITRNKSRNFPFNEFLLPLNKNSISGYVGLTGDVLNLENVNTIPEIFGLKYNDSFDKKTNYKTVNMLVIPMKDYAGNVVGVLQLLNKKKNKEIVFGDDIEEIAGLTESFTKEEENTILSLASQAAILLERTKLYDEIQMLFQSFIETMVATLDARDITTSGHSKRLAGYAIKLAEKINRVDYGKYKDFYFTKEDIKELYYAALLHDVGKIGIPENILLKKNKLSDDRINVIKYRMSYLKKNLEIRKLMHKIDDNEEEVLKKIDIWYEKIFEINRKGYSTEEEIGIVNSISKIEFIDLDGKINNLLDEYEVENLTIHRGNLTDEERTQMNLHVTYTYEILKGIAWINGLKKIPEIAGAHHEKLDGTGYPKGLFGDEITVQDRMLAVLDIFEALTARDRPYKPPMPVEKAIDILADEVKKGHLDADIFEIFVKENVHELYKSELNKVIRL